MVHNYTLQPLLTNGIHKQHTFPNSKPFHDTENIRLKCFEDAADWLQDDWHGDLLEDHKNTMKKWAIKMMHALIR